MRRYGLGVVLIACIVMATQSLPAWQRATPKSTIWQTTPRNQEPASNDSAISALREKRSLRFNDPSGLKRRYYSTEPSKSGHGTAPPFFVKVAPLPMEESQAVVLGEVVSFQPFFSQDGTGIYTELHVRIDAIVKSTNGMSIGGLISIPFRGGSIALPDGRVARQYVPQDEKTIDVGGRYLLFLRHDKEVDQFSVVKVWELVDGKVQPRAGSDIRDARSGHSRYAGLSESEFMAILRECARTPTSCN